MPHDLIDEGYKVHFGFLHVLLGGESWYDITEDEDLYASFEHSYKQLCIRISDYMDQLPHLFGDKSAIHRCLWYWGYFTLYNLTRVLNTDDLPHLKGLREESNLEEFIRSLQYLISITPPPPSYLDDPVLCTRNWTQYQIQLPMLAHVYRRQCQINRSVARFCLCIIL